MTAIPPLEQAILEAARTNDNSLGDLLDIAYQTLGEAAFDRLYDKAHQIMTEALREARGWKDEVDE